MQAEDIFQAALNTKTPAERQAFLDAACGADAGLRSQVEGLLHSHQAAGSFLEAPLFATSPTIDGPPRELAGTRIGPYKLLQQIGEGGMGAVYMAEQKEPVQRRVALKVVKAGLDSRQVIARFEAERQALALMDHVNIARVLDAGATDAGRPYFVMELVHGAAITSYCDDHRLTPRQRLELFVPVCQAIQHAHQKGIIHRDIKPSNVMVTLYDGRPVPKVIDFGVAKATEQALTERTHFTQYGTLVGTLEYMSPEQAETSALGVDTRSDIYSLGVLLYELLTGSTPLGSQQLKQAAYAEILRMIKEEEPPKPSTRLSDSGAALATISAQRQMEPAKLTRLVRGELDWIVMKTLEKDRNRRYETANALVQDIQRYLADEPVEACPPSRWYRFRKFARRNKGALAVASATILAGLTLVVGIMWHNARLAAKIKEVDEQRILARRQAERADANFAKSLEAVDKFLSRIGQDRLAQVPGMERVRREVLEEALQFFQGFLRQKGDEPVVRWEAAQAHFRVGHIQNLLGQHREAEEAYLRASELLGQLTAEFPAKAECHVLAAACQTNLAMLLKATGRYADASPAFERAVQLNEELVRQDPDDTSRQRSLASTYSDLATMLTSTGQLEGAERRFGRALEMQEKLVAQAPADLENRENLARSHLNHGLLLKSTGQLADAENAYRRAVELFEKLVADVPADAEYRHELCGVLLNLGVVQETTERTQQAEASFGRAVELAGKLAADFPSVPDYRSLLAKSRLNLAARLQDAGRLMDAQRDYALVLELFEKLARDFPGVPEYRRDLAGCLNNMGAMQFDARRLSEAATLLRRAVDIRRALAAEPAALPQDRSLSATAQYNLAVLLAQMDLNQDAEDAYRGARAELEKLVSELPQTIHHRHMLGAVLNNLSGYFSERGELQESRTILERAIEHQTIALRSNAQHPVYRAFLANHYRSLAEVLVLQAEHGEAIRIAAESPRLYPSSEKEHVRAAEFAARCIPLAERDARLTEEQRRTLAEEYATAALSWLRTAVAHGYKGAEQLSSEPAFTPLRPRADFQKLLRELDDQ